ncbi:MAG: hypothetical protein ACMX3H_13750 [Sodalis sp. (in: enterobacteria)]|uniref:hypothetical protein n=1 Tax=Sodalis sp. (in: enterobacteria) TaxID=1898979 RepID=UPI0039E52C28
MRTYKKSRRERWMKTRQKDFLHYILVRSLLGWGVTSVVALLLLVYWLFDTPVINFAGLLTFIVYVLISVLRGCIKWVMMEKELKSGTK